MLPSLVLDGDRSNLEMIIPAEKLYKHDLEDELAPRRDVRQVTKNPQNSSLLGRIPLSRRRS